MGFSGNARKKSAVFVLTFFAYVSYHASRKSFANVSATMQNGWCSTCNETETNTTSAATAAPRAWLRLRLPPHSSNSSNSSAAPGWHAWRPQPQCLWRDTSTITITITGTGTVTQDDATLLPPWHAAAGTAGAQTGYAHAHAGTHTASTNATQYCREEAESFVGLLDTCFMFAYSLGLFFFGWLGDLVGRQRVLVAGMLLSCGFVLGFTALAVLGSSPPWAYLVVWTANGFFQASGWPNVVGIMGEWFPRSENGALARVQPTDSITSRPSSKWRQNLDLRCVLLSDPSTDRCSGSQPKHVSNPE